MLPTVTFTMWFTWVVTHQLWKIPVRVTAADFSVPCVTLFPVPAVRSRVAECFGARCILTESELPQTFYLQTALIRLDFKNAQAWMNSLNFAGIQKLALLDKDKLSTARWSDFFKIAKQPQDLKISLLNDLVIHNEQIYLQHWYQPLMNCRTVPKPHLYCIGRQMKSTRPAHVFKVK